MAIVRINNNAASPDARTIFVSFANSRLVMDLDPNGPDRGETQLNDYFSMVLHGDDWTQNGSAYEGTVTSFSFGRVGLINQFVQFSVEGLSLSLADFLANRSNLMLFALAGDDTAYGTNRANIIEMGDGNDLIYGYGGDDNLQGQGGDDRLFGGGGNDVLAGGSGNDRLYGGDGDDMIIGHTGADIVVGGAGADLMEGNAYLDDGSIDTLSYASSNAAVRIDMVAGTGLGGHAEGDLFSGFEAVIGSRFNDEITGTDTGVERLNGGAGNDILAGLGGDDILRGGDGDDTIYGGNGADLIRGGAGNDTIYLDSGNDRIWLDAGGDTVVFNSGNGRDVIRDFVSGEDVINFSDSDMSLSDLQASAREVAAGVVFRNGPDSILLAGLHLSDINWQTDFLFA